MKIEVRDENFAVLKEHTKEEWTQIRSLLSYKTQTFIRGKWTAIPHYLIHGKTKVFPTGLLSIITSKFKVEITDLRPKHIPITLPESIPLDAYQKQIMRDALRYQRAIVNVPTGAGKTYTFSTFAAYINRPTIIITPTQEILCQVVEHITKYTTDIRIMWNTSHTTFDKRIIVTTSGTLNSRFDFLKEEGKKIEVMISDEAHFYGADSFFKISHLFPNAWIRLGFSGTPIGRSDNADLRTLSVFSPCIVTYQGEIERIVPVKVFLVDYCSNTRWSDPEDYEQLLEDVERQEAIVKLVNILRKERLTPYLVFVDRIKYGETLSEKLSIPLITSISPERDTIFDDLRNEKLEGIVTTIGWIGLDIPNLKVVVNTSRETTSISLGQKAGRVRRKIGKDVGIVFDFLDRGRLPSRWARKRRKTYESLGFEVIQTKL